MLKLSKRVKVSCPAVQILSSCWRVSTFISLRAQTVSVDWWDGALHSLHILWWPQCCMCESWIGEATLKAFMLLNNCICIHVSSRFCLCVHMTFCLKASSAQESCLRIQELWLWSFLICKITFSYSCVCLLANFKVTGSGSLPYENMQEIDKWFIFWSSFCTYVNPLKSKINLNYI